MLSYSDPLFNSSIYVGNRPIFARSSTLSLFPLPWGSIDLPFFFVVTAVASDSLEQMLVKFGDQEVSSLSAVSDFFIALKQRVPLHFLSSSPPPPISFPSSS